MSRADFKGRGFFNVIFKISKYVGAKGKRRNGAQNKERSKAEKNGGSTREPAFVLQKSDGHFKQGDGRGKRSHKEAEVKDHRYDAAARELRKNHGQRDEDEAGPGIGLKAVSKHSGHDDKPCQNGCLTLHRKSYWTVREFPVRLSAWPTAL